MIFVPFGKIKRLNYDNNVVKYFLFLCLHSFIQGKLLNNTKQTTHDDIIDDDGFVRLQLDREHEYRIKNRQHSDNAMTGALSAFYAKLIVVLGIAFPVTDILAVKAPNAFYQGFYLFLYIGSISFVVFMYIDHLRTRRIYSLNANGEIFLRAIECH